MTITVETRINSSLEQVWKAWTEPEHITQWNFATETWCCPSASNDLQPGGELNWRMEARDGSMGFDYKGTYKKIDPLKYIQYHIEDGRMVEIHFEEGGDSVLVRESFETEEMNPPDLQRNGWQAILDQFRKHVESLG